MPDAAERAAHSAALGRHLSGLIRSHGPLTIDRWMADVLGHPEHGYYMTRDPFGLEGDFITAPEVSQMFGELLGLWCAQTWHQMGSPKQVKLAELGPGRGTLMADAMRAAKAMPGFSDAAEIHLMETSRPLREMQRQALSNYDVTWHDGFETIPNGPLLLITNELFDALPIRQFERTLEGWAERLVDLAPGDSEGREFRLVLSPAPAPAAKLLSKAVQEAPIGSIAELCPAGLRLAHDIADRIAKHGGAALIIDYGYVESRPGDTLQAVLKHKTHPILEAPGSADICAHVDFAMLARSARQCGVEIAGPVEQGAFLRSLGIAERARALQANAGREAVIDIGAALERLTGPGAMGNLFKVLCLRHPDLPNPAGFEAAVGEVV